MDSNEIKKPFSRIISVYIVWVAMCIVIVSLLTTVARADDALGDVDVGTIIGIILSSTFGFGVGGLGIVLSAIGMNLGPQKPELAKGFGIADFVFILSCLGAMTGGAIAASNGLVEVIDCSIHNSSPLWRANCTADIIYNSVIISCMVVMVLISVSGIKNCVKLVSTINQSVPRAGFVTSVTSSPQTTPASGSQGKFCSACGAPNEVDAKFCKKCGKAC